MGAALYWLTLQGLIHTTNLAKDHLSKAALDYTHLCTHSHPTYDLFLFRFANHSTRFFVQRKGAKTVRLLVSNFSRTLQRADYTNREQMLELVRGSG